MKRHSSVRRKGGVLVLFAMVLPILIGLAAFAIDIGYIGFAHSRLQAAADGAALAAAEELPRGAAAVNAAQTIGGLNFPNKSGIVAGEDVEFGIWSEADLSLTPTSAAAANAVRVTARLSEENGNALPLFFARFLGFPSTNVTASACATAPASGIGTRFLIDDEMIDTDIPAIQALATDEKTVDQLLTARGFNAGKEYGADNWEWEDNFLDLPVNAEIRLPTGQGTGYGNNDAALFDIDHTNFPFTDIDRFRNFVMYSETGGDPTKWGTDDGVTPDGPRWGTDDEKISGNLDPLQGVSPVTNGGEYESFCSETFVHVSPVTYSDISTLDQQDGVPQINAKGLRRGLIAFKIIEVGDDIDGPEGPVLPELIIKIVDPPKSLDDLRPTSEGGGAEYRLVQ